MRRMKKNTERPWLTSTGVEIDTAELREISKSWSAETWRAYLKWFESGKRERLVQPWIYNKIGDEQTESVFIEFGHDTDPEQQRRCEQLLGHVNQLEAMILRQIFFQGSTEREIAAKFRIAKSSVHDLKNRALLRLKRGNSGDGSGTRQFMRGENFSSQANEPSIWDEPLQYPLKEDRPYSPENHKTEFDRIKTHSVRVALQSLTDTAQQILYLRYWCDFSVSQIARRLGRGVNVVEQIESASASKVKRAALKFELGITLGGDQC